jgi:hypothetical protein
VLSLVAMFIFLGRFSVLYLCPTNVTGRANTVLLNLTACAYSIKVYRHANELQCLHKVRERVFWICRTHWTLVTINKETHNIYRETVLLFARLNIPVNLIYATVCSFLLKHPVQCCIILISVWNLHLWEDRLCITTAGHLLDPMRNKAGWG